MRRVTTKIRVARKLRANCCSLGEGAHSGLRQWGVLFRLALALQLMKFNSKAEAYQTIAAAKAQNDINTRTMPRIHNECTAAECTNIECRNSQRWL